MKIDLYISSLSGGGAENVLVMLSKWFAGEGHNVSISSLEKRKQFYDIPANVTLFKNNNTTNNKIVEFIKDFSCIRERMSHRDADVSIAFLSRCNLLLLLAAFFSNRKVVVCDRNNPLKEHSKLVFMFSCMIYRRANRIIVQTKQIKEMYPKYLRKKITVLENPLDIEKLSAQIDGKELKKEKVIISVGRLEKQKDFITLIQAFHNISSKYPEWNIKIFGVGDMKDELQRFIDDSGENGRIQLCGHTKEPFVEMNKASIFVLSSFYEGFPNVLCEAMYAGLPCISTDCVSGPRELIKNNVNGLLVPIADVQAMQESIEQLIQNPKMRTDLGREAKKTSERLKLESIAQKWLLMIDHVEEK